MNIEEHTIYEAIQILEDKTGLKGRWFASLTAKDIDGKLELRSGKTRTTFPAVFKREVKNTYLVNFLSLKEEHPGFIIIAEKIYPIIREQLRKMGINYLDNSGNCYIKENEWIFLIDGFKPESVPTSNKTSRGFSKTALLLIFHFLYDEKYLQMTYRQMAEDYGIALGNINKIITNLKDRGYLIQVTSKHLKIINKRELFDEWIISYQQKLKPVINLGNFRFLNRLDKEWQRLPLRNTETQWGAEPAANLLTGYLKPGQLTLYTVESKAQLIKKYRLIPDEKGQLQICKKFWVFNTGTDTVPVLLVYADLIITGDPRNLETAKRLYDGLLKDQF